MKETAVEYRVVWRITVTLTGEAYCLFITYDIPIIVSREISCGNHASQKDIHHTTSQSVTRTSGTPPVLMAPHSSKLGWV